MLTLAEIPNWLPVALIALGAAILAFLLGAGLKSVWGRKSTGGQPPTSPQQLQSQLIEVKRLAGSIADDLDKRAARLESLIAEADRRVATLNNSANGSPQPRPTSSTRDPVTDPDESTLRIYRLADQGKTPIQIAQALQEHVGKVELILALRRA